MASSARGSRRCGKSRSMNTAGASSPDTSQELRDFLTCGVAGCTICERLMLSAADSPARTLATPESAPESTESAAGCGANTRASFASFDRATSSWRTSQLCLDGEWSEFSETWPRSGMTRSGIAYQRPRLVPHISVTGFSSWPTPVSSMGERGGRGDLLAIVRGMPNKHIRRYPTPRAEERGQYQRDRGQKGKERLTLTGVAKLWATPASSDGRRGPDKKRAERTDGGRDLVTDVGGQLNPTWVEWLMGYPLGWTDLEDSATRSCRKSRNGSGKG